MRLTAKIEGDLREITAGEVRKGKRAVSMAMAAAGAQVKDRWRDQIAAAGFQGNVGGLQRAIRSQTYPRDRQSLNASAYIWARGKRTAPMMSANEEGVVIRSTNGFWLAIPTEAAGRGAGSRKLTPHDWEQKTGRKLQFVYRAGKPSLLIDKGQYLRPWAQKRRGKWALQSFAPGFRAGDVSRERVIFVLVPQVRLRKRLSVYAMAAQVGATLPARVAALWRD